ncbi:lamin tail domain-containing protein, partial [Arthrospira platensis SPKY2]
SEVQVRGGVGFATEEFIELYNRTDTPYSLAGHTVQYRGSQAGSFQVIQLSGEIPAFGYFLIAHSVSSFNAQANVTYGGSGLSQDGATVFLVNGTAALSSGS